MYQCKYFKIEELVPQELFEQYRDNQYLLWWVFDGRLLYIADRLRNDHGPMTCNDGLGGGERNKSGFRPFNAGEYAAGLSQHKFGRALDLIPKNIHPDEIRKDIQKNKFPYMEDITGLELNISWLHFDTRNNKGQRTVFDPNS